MAEKDGAELKSCPFCGGRADTELSDFGSAMAYCTNDDCDIHPDTGFHDSRETAIAIWNTRASDALLAERDAEIAEKAAQLADARAQIESLVSLQAAMRVNIEAKQQLIDSLAEGGNHEAK